MFEMYHSNRTAPPKTSFFPSGRVTSPTPPSRNSRYVDNAHLIFPAMDGPPSPERIRAYTEQMRMASQNPAQVNMYSHGADGYAAAPSLTSSLMSASSSGSDFPTLSRKTSRSSTGKKSFKGDRPDSVLNFGKALFSRSKKSKRETTGSRSSSSLSNYVSTIDEEYQDNSVLARELDNVVGFGKKSRRGFRSNSSASLIDDSISRPQISGPYNFQHVTHTRQDHLPDLQRADRMELVSEFSAIRASQAPTQGTLKEIRVQDLHFENFSSEAIHEEPGWRPMTHHQRTLTITKPTSPPRQRLTHAQSHDSLRQSPPRPFQASRNPVLPVAPPPRTSSRGIVSGIWEHFDAVAPNNFTRPQTTASARMSKAFHLPISPPTLIQHSSDAFFFQDAIKEEPVSESETWPLASPEFEMPKQSLPDVPEEDDEALMKRRSCKSMRRAKSADVLGSFQHDMEESVLPILRPTFDERPITPLVTDILLDDETIQDTGAVIGLALSPSKTPSNATHVKLAHESWEDDIDYCYEHEVEANCDYEWDRHSVDIEPQHDSLISSTEPIVPDVDSSMELPTRFRPSLLVPSALDLPSLSPTTSMSSITPTSVRTTLTPLLPSNRPSHLRSHSRADSFKESQGFNLSPSLLIPSDYAAAMDSSDAEPGFRSATLESTYNTVPAQERDTRCSTTSSATSTYRSSALSRTSHTSTNTSASSVIMSSPLLPKSSQENITSHQTVRPSGTGIKPSAPTTQHHHNITSSIPLPDLAPYPHHLKSQVHLENLEYADLAAPSPGIPYVSDRPSSSHSNRLHQHRRAATTSPASFSRPLASHKHSASADTMSKQAMNEDLKVTQNVAPASLPLSPVHENVDGAVVAREESAPKASGTVMDKVHRSEKTEVKQEKPMMKNHARIGSAPLLIAKFEAAAAAEREKNMSMNGGGMQRASSGTGRGKGAGAYGLFPQI